MSTFSLIMIAVLSFGVAALSGYIVIPRLRKLHIGQTISEYVKEHQGKANTPTIGGVMFIIPAVVFTLLGVLLGNYIGFDISSDGIKRIFASVIMVLAKF